MFCFALFSFYCIITNPIVSDFLLRSSGVTDLRFKLPNLERSIYICPKLWTWALYPLFFFFLLSRESSVMLLCMVFRLYPLSRVSSYYLLTFIFSSFAYFERYLQTFTNSYNYRNMLSILTRRQPCGLLLLSIIIHFLPFPFFLFFFVFDSLKL